MRFTNGPINVLVMGVLALCARHAFADALPTEHHDNSQGVWLRSAKIEAFVAVRPQFRVLAIRTPGGESLLAGSKSPEQGVRLGYMESQQVKTSFDVGNQPGELSEQTPTSAKVRLNPTAGLRYDITLRLDDASPIVHLETTLANVGDAPRRVGAWTVLAFERGHAGLILAPFDKEPRSRRRLVLPWWTRWPQDTWQFGRDVAVVDTAAPMQGAHKLGLISNAGWIAYQRGQQAIVLDAPFDPKADYPEDGANLTLYQCHTDKVWCEIEQVAPLQTIAPGEATKPYAHNIRLVTLDPTAPPPTTQPGQTDVDKLRLTLEAALTSSVPR